MEILRDFQPDTLFSPSVTSSPSPLPSPPREGARTGPLQQRAPFAAFESCEDAEATHHMTEVLAALPAQ